MLPEPMQRMRRAGSALALALALLLPAGCSQLRGIIGGAASSVLTGPRAHLQDAQGRDVGSVTFEQTPNGVLVRADLHDLPAGTHGFHIHSVGVCVPDFTSAGGHFNPFNRKHGIRNEEGPHAGDLPNLEVGSDGVAKAEFLAVQATLTEGAPRLLDADGAAVVVHAGADDYRSDPAGNAGARIACGVITR